MSLGTILDPLWSRRSLLPKKLKLMLQTLGENYKVNLVFFCYETILYGTLPVLLSRLMLLLYTLGGDEETSRMEEIESEDVIQVCFTRKRDLSFYLPFCL
jgi:hypothetical protein